jgi:hypothetical protein
MKNLNKIACLLAVASLMLVSCNDFTSVNTDPTSASKDQVQVQYFIDNSIIAAQMNPDVAERSFVLYWKIGAHQAADVDGGVFSVADYNDQWTGDYYGQIASWLNHVNTAIQVAKSQIKSGNDKKYTKNLVQVARIWRAYLMAVMSDNFGPIPVKAFQGKNPDFNSVKDVYYYILSELKDASQKLDLTVDNPTGLADEDPAYGYDYARWQKFANSLRLRYAMRLSQADPSKAKSEFEDADKDLSKLITNADETFEVQEKQGWDALTGVMSRTWDTQPLSVTLNNIYVGLGSVKSADQLGSDFQSAIKPIDWHGVKYTKFFPTKTNDPMAGYWFDGLPNTIDPRAYKAFSIPGNINAPNYPKQNGDYDTKTVHKLKNKDGSTAHTINAKNTWNARVDGDWGAKNAMNELVNYGGTMPRLKMQFRDSQSKRVFFQPSETYFLIAEAAVRGWSTPISGKEAYEDGIKANFNYWGISQYLSTYLNSTEYNRLGTSVKWDHTAEPPDTHTMKYKDGKTGKTGTVKIKYPVNNLYKNGTVRNDHLTKIITQKFIAELPWLPMEAWSDHRRLGLPFFENPAIVKPIPTLPALTNSTYMTSSQKFFPQRLKYPSSLKNSNKKGYDEAVQELNGQDAVLTPLWWAQGAQH